MKIVIGCSVRYRDLIADTMRRLETFGITPLFPNLNPDARNTDNALDAEEKAKLAWEHYAAIEEADAVYLILPEGKMGTSVTLELGYALALRKPVYFSELTNDSALDHYPKAIIPLNQLSSFLKDLPLL